VRDAPKPSAGLKARGKVVNFREGWRSFVLYALFFVLVIAGWRDLPSGDSILPW
jgi:hypothetical protein